MFILEKYIEQWKKAKRDKQSPESDRRSKVAKYFFFFSSAIIIKIRFNWSAREQMQTSENKAHRWTYFSLTGTGELIGLSVV